MRFRYRAVDATGRVVRGRWDAANLADLEWRLAKQNLTLIRAVEARQMRLWQVSAISRRDLIGFCFHLEQLTHAGIPLIEGLNDLRDHAENYRLRTIAAVIVADVEGGMPLSKAMEAYPGVFDAVFVQLIRAGEVSGMLPEIFRQLAETLKWQDELAAQTRKILLYPVFVALLVCAVILFLMLSLVPQLVTFVQEMGQDLPLSTRILITLSDLLTHYGGYIALLIVSSIWALSLRIRHDPAWRKYFDGSKLRLPLLGSLLHKIILARFARTFAMLYAAGIPVLDCINISVGIVGNTQFADSLTQLSIRIMQGTGLTAGFKESQLFPPLLLRMLHMGETTGALDTALYNVAYFYGRDVRESIASIQALIEPTLIVTLGLLLAWIMSAVLGPIFDTIGTVR